MENYFLILGVAGLLNLVAFIWLLIVGFKRSVVWGILIFLFSPLSALFFAVTNWYDAKKPFLAYLITSIALIVGLVMFIGDYGRDMQEIKEAVDSGRINPNEAAQYIGKTDQLPGNELEEDLDPEMAEGDQLDAVDGETLSAEQAITTEQDSTSESGDTAEADKATMTDEPAIATAKQEEVAAAEAVMEEDEPSPYPSLDKVMPDPLVAKKKTEAKNTTRVGINKIKNYIGRYFEVTKKDGTKHRGILVKVTKSRIILERKIYSGSFTYKVRKTQIKRADMFKKEYVEEIS